MNKNDVAKLINGIGAIAEVSGLFLKELMKNGFTREESMVLVGEMIKVTFSSAGGNNDR